MNFPSSRSSPTYKNLQTKHKMSPVDLKERMRKNYKDKIQNCRDMLLNRFRGTGVEENLHKTLTDIYKSMFQFSADFQIDDEEITVLEEIKRDLVQEEFNWWLEEYEKSHMENVDWSYLDQENNVICPICEKTNYTLQSGILCCKLCNYKIKTQKTFLEIKKSIDFVVDQHNTNCHDKAQFTLVPELNEDQIYLMCSLCNDMSSVI